MTHCCTQITRVQDKLPQVAIVQRRAMYEAEGKRQQPPVQHTAI